MWSPEEIMEIPSSVSQRRRQPDINQGSEDDDVEDLYRISAQGNSYLSLSPSPSS
jgi:hypothetical protein